MIPLALSLGTLKALLEFLTTPVGQKVAEDWRAVLAPLGDGIKDLILQIQADLKAAQKP